MTGNADPIAPLRQYLERQPAGPLDNEDVLGLLVECWDAFEGTRETNMQPDKLYRLEKPEWHPPELSFQIERHGATVMGSSRAALYKWIINLETRQASCVNAGHRQLRPMDERLDVKPIARSLAEAIMSGEDDPRLRRNSDGSVRVKIGDVIPETNKQTTAGRRKRLRTELSVLLREKGWRQLRPNVYTRD